ncbi:hypothetical protein [Propionibacterium freudenreichii]|uniref:hypothetical protein n=1 Tax=Propionibacterium freudenreichii TaxID=1744 RepID=UPI0038555423
MGALDRIKQADEQQKTTELLEALISQRDADRQQIERLTKAVADLTGYVKVMDEEQTIRLDRLSTSPRLELPSTLPLDAETRKRLNEIEKTLSSVAQQLSSSEVVKLPDGSSVTRADLAAYSMMEKILTRLETTGQSSADLADAVRKRGRIVIDTQKLTEHAVKVLDARLAKAVDARIGDFEQRVAALGTVQAAQAVEQVEAVTAKADEVMRAVDTAERRVDALAGRVTWATAGRLALSLLPLAAVLLVVGGLKRPEFVGDS